jgi:hypothetical protein
MEGIGSLQRRTAKEEGCSLLPSPAFASRQQQGQLGQDLAGTLAPEIQ